MDLGFIEILLLITVIYLLFTILKMNDQIKGMKYTLNHLAKHMDIPENPINNDLRELIREDEEIKAIKLVRETLGLTLVEARQYIDNLKTKIKYME